jgi:hypothetical protein
MGRFGVDASYASAVVEVEAVAPTPTGANVPVYPGPAKLVFGLVTTTGTTTVETSATPPAQSGFTVNGAYYEISTTAAYTGIITITLPYNPATVSNPAALRLYHYTGSPGSWDDITTSVDTVNHTVSGVSRSLSPFAVGMPTRTFDGFLQPINGDGSSIFQINSTIPVKFRLTNASGAPVTTAVAHLYVAQISAGVTGTEQEAVSTSAADTGNTFRYDSSANQYIFNWGTRNLAQGTWQIRAALDDGTSHTVQVSLRSH